MNPIWQQLIDFLKTASPLVWEIIMKQVYSNMIANVLWVIGLIVASIILAKLGKTSWEKHKRDEYAVWDLASGFAYAGSVISGIIAFGISVHVIQILLNPQYYGIQFILNTLP